MTDLVLRGFLQRQYEEGMALAAASDLFELIPLAGNPPRRCVARFRCTGLVRAEDGSIIEADDFAVGIFFRDDHLRALDPYTLAMWLSPSTIVHPNVRVPFVCLGNLGVGATLVEVIYQLFEIIKYNKATLDDALNGEAAAWSRRNQHRFPSDRRPLKRRALAGGDAGPAADLDFAVVEIES